MVNYLLGCLALVVVSAAALVALAWAIHSHFYRDDTRDPFLMNTRQLNYMREVRERSAHLLAEPEDDDVKDEAEEDRRGQWEPVYD